MSLLSPEWTICPSPNGVRTKGWLGFEKTEGHLWMCATRGTQGWTSGTHAWQVRTLTQT